MELTVSSLVPLLTAVGTGIARSAGGWLDNVLDTKSEGGVKITKFEWAKLVGTTVRVSLVTTALYFGVEGLFGTDVTLLGAAAGAYVVDLVLKKIN